MAQALHLIVFPIFSALVAGLPAHNVTLSVPDGFTDHGNNDLYCTQSQWYDVLVFFALNYASHAATVKSRPGQTYIHTARDVVLSLVYPYAGLTRALESLARSSWTTNDLTKAARAGALCIVVRNKDWKPSWRTRILAGMPNGSLAETSCDQIPGDSVELETEVTGGKINKETVAEQGVLDPSSNVLSNATHRSSTHTHDESSKNGQDIESHVKSDESTNGITTSNTVPSVQETSESFAHSSRDKTPGLPSWLRGFLRSGSTFEPFARSSRYKAPDLPSWLRSFLDKSSIWTRNIQGECRLPEGYSVAMLPSNATLVSSIHEDLEYVTISSSHSIANAVVAIVQVIYASITVYRARGDQVDRFGYAAFGFTVLPYIVMSLMNLLSGLLLPDYPTLYIVRSLESDEATLLGGTIDGTVGRLVQRNDDYNDFLHGSNVCEKDGKQDANSAEDDMTAKQSRRIESRQTHIEEDSRRSSEAGSAGFVASVIGSPPSNAFDTHYCANYERHQQNGEEIRDSAAQEDSLHQSQCRGDNENITFYAASKVKCLNLNPKDRHASYTPFATNGDTERWRDQPGRTLKSYPSLAYLAVVYVFSAIPLAVIGGMTRFHSGHSTHAQRAWTMSWMTFNLLYGAALEWVFDPNLLQGRNLLQGGREAKSYHLMLAVLVFAIPAIGGFVTVGQMLREYGSCTVIGGL